MRKRLLIALTILCVASMAGCGSNSGSTSNNTTNNVAENGNNASTKEESGNSDTSASEEDVKQNTKIEPGLSITTENLTEAITQSAENVLLEGKLEVTINGTTFNYFDDYETVVRPLLVSAGYDMDVVERTDKVPVIGEDGTEVNVLFQVREVDGKKIIKEVGYALPTFMEDNKPFENIAQINGYNVTEMEEFTSAIGITKENTVFVNSDQVKLRINVEAKSFDIFHLE